MQTTIEDIKGSLQILNATSVADIVDLLEKRYVSPNIAVKTYPNNALILEKAYQISPDAIRYASQEVINELGRKGIISKESVLKAFPETKIPSEEELSTNSKQFANYIAQKSWSEAAELCRGFWFENTTSVTKQELRKAIVTELKENQDGTKSWQALYDFDKKNFEDGETNSLPSYGPLNKTEETYQLEDLAREMMRSERFILEKRNNQEIIIFPEYNTFFWGKVHKKEFNWTLIREKANFQHVQLNEKDFTLYKNYLNQPNCCRDVKDSLKYFKEERAEAYIKNLFGPECENPPLTLAEVQAIRIYSGGLNETINKIMREPINLTDKIVTTELRTGIIHAVLIASGLQKFPDSKPNSKYIAQRGLKYQADTLEKFIKAAAQREVITVNGFISSYYTANQEPEVLTYAGRSIQLNLNSIRGHYIAPISIHPVEQEYLILPTKLHFNNYEYKYSVFNSGFIPTKLHFFNTTLVNPLAEDFQPIVRADQHPILKHISCDDIAKYVLDGIISPSDACRHYANSDKVVLASYTKDPNILGFIDVNRALNWVSDGRVSFQDVQRVFSQNTEVIKKHWNTSFNPLVKFFSQTFIKNLAYVNILSLKIPKQMQKLPDNVIRERLAIEVQALELKAGEIFDKDMFIETKCKDLYDERYLNILGELLEERFCKATFTP